MLGAINIEISSQIEACRNRPYWNVCRLSNCVCHQLSTQYWYHIFYVRTHALIGIETNTERYSLIVYLRWRNLSPKICVNNIIVLKRWSNHQWHYRTFYLYKTMSHRHELDTLASFLNNETCFSCCQPRNVNIEIFETINIPNSRIYETVAWRRCIGCAVMS